MASIFKRSKRRNAPYLIQYLDHLGKRRTAKGYTDKGLTEELAAKLESEARLRQTGMIDPIQDRIAEQKQTDIELQLAAFEESLSDNSPKYVKLTMTRVRRIVNDGGFATLVGIDGEQVQSVLRSLRKSDGIGHRTYNHYIQAFDTFCNWCVVTKRLLSNPILGLERLNTAVDVRHARRALSAEEFSHARGFGSRKPDAHSRVLGRTASTYLYAVVHDGLAKERNSQPYAAKFQAQRVTGNGDGRGGLFQASP